MFSGWCLFQFIQFGHLKCYFISASDLRLAKINICIFYSIMKHLFFSLIILSVRPRKVLKNVNLWLAFVFNKWIQLQQNSLNKQTLLKDPRNQWCVVVHPVKAAQKADRNCNEVCKQEDGSFWVPFFGLQYFLWTHYSKDRGETQGKEDEMEKYVLGLSHELETVWQVRRLEGKPLVKEAERRRNGWKMEINLLKWSNYIWKVFYTTLSITTEHPQITLPHPQLFGKLKPNKCIIEVEGESKRKQPQALHSLWSEWSPAGPFIPSAFLWVHWESKHFSSAPNRCAEQWWNGKKRQVQAAAAQLKPHRGSTQHPLPSSRE